MSNFRAIATVTATLQAILQAAVNKDVPGAQVMALRPSEMAGGGAPTTAINLFLYQVAVNPHRANDDLPTRRSGGDAIVRPTAALDLYYLMSFYGDEKTLEAQRLLGSATAFLHGEPQIPRAEIQKTVANASNAFLAGSDLADQPDVIRLAPTSLTFDELSRLWSVFLQTQYVLSTTFKASTILLERQIATQPALPTRELRLASATMRSPVISRIVAQAGPDAPITAGGVIAIQGQNLLGDAAFVDLDGAPAPLLSSDDAQLTLTLPAGLAAGPHTALVRRGVKLSGASDARPAFPSNLAAFVLQPAITQTAGKFDIAVANVQGTGAAPRSATVTLDVAPQIGAGQTATLELSGSQGVLFTFMAAPRAAAAGELVFNITGVPAGDYFVQTRVAGAASPLQLDANRVPLAPKATIP